MTLDEARAAGGKKATLLFPTGSYTDALASYYVARDFLLSNGLCYHERVCGVIKSPEFKGRPSPNPVPNEWIDEPHWQTRVTLECLDFRAVNDVKQLAVPAGAQLEWAEL